MGSAVLVEFGAEEMREGVRLEEGRGGEGSSGHGYQRYGIAAVRW